jgi:hypothetical protein
MAAAARTTFAHSHWWATAASDQLAIVKRDSIEVARAPQILDRQSVTWVVQFKT